MRECIFFDVAIRGAKSNRPGFNQLKEVLESKQVQALLLFATNRLFRKSYKTLEFVDDVHKSLQIRCIFVKSGIDTHDKQGWEQLLAAHALIDQFAGTANVENIRSAHEGLLEQLIVHGTITYGYGGEPIPDRVTKRNLPARRLVICAIASAIVLRIFTWFVNDRVSREEIVRRLNATPGIPLPPKCTTGLWTRLAVRGILRNTRYRGWWKYGDRENVFLPKQDYVRQYERAEPLKARQIESLRIVSDELWYGRSSAWPTKATVAVVVPATATGSPGQSC